MNRVLLKFKYFLIMLALLTMIVPQTFAQEEDEDAPPPPKNHSVTWDLPALFAGGLKFGFDIRVKDRNWIQIIPIAYLYPGITSYMDWGYNDHHYNYYDEDYVIAACHGFGIGANYKRFLLKHEFLYCHGGIDYSFRRAKISGYDFIPYEDDDFPSYIYDKLYEKQDFHRVSLTACMGIQTLMRYGFYVDGYMGIGYKYAFYDKNKLALDEEVNDYGYRGLYPVIGFRLGVAF